MFKWFKKLFSKPVPEVTEPEYSMSDFVKDLESALLEKMKEQQPDFIKTDDYNKIQYEFETNEIETEHWSDSDYLECLLDYLSQGYKFDGLQDLYKKVQSGKDLSQNESAKLRDWYKLVSTEVVYDV